MAFKMGLNLFKIAIPARMLVKPSSVLAPA
jgi:hypothetical protein